jgi:hypothetical protein
MEKTARKPQKDRFSPPDWWRKWRPLRWLAGGALLVLLAMWGRGLLEGDAAAPSPAQAEAPAEPAIEPEVAEVAAAEPAPVVAPEPEPVPAPEPKPAPAAPAAKPAPAPVAVIEELPSQQVSDYKAYTRVETSVIELMAFRSYASLDSVAAALEKAGYSPELSSNHRRVPEEYPPYDIDRISIGEYRHLGQTGALTLQFFNDRLFEVEFRPNDAQAYTKAFRGQYPQLPRSKTGRTEWTSGQLRMASSLDLAVSDVGRALRTQAYVIWQDRRLVGQRDNWDARYAPELAR